MKEKTIIYLYSYFCVNVECFQIYYISAKLRFAIVAREETYLLDQSV